jgi:hemoglobin
MSRDVGRPPPLGDLGNPGEIAEMVRRFYREVAQDDLLGPVFNDVARVDWGEHLPKLTNFWCRALLGVEGYSGNPFRVHARVHALSPLTPGHFARWLEIFDEIVGSGWAGPYATRAMALAHDVSRVHSRQLARGLGCAGADLTLVAPGEMEREQLPAAIRREGSPTANR